MTKHVTGPAGQDLKQKETHKVCANHVISWQCAFGKTFNFYCCTFAAEINAVVKWKSIREFHEIQNASHKSSQYFINTLSNFLEIHEISFGTLKDFLILSNARFSITALMTFLKTHPHCCHVFFTLSSHWLIMHNP